MAEYKKPVSVARYVPVHTPGTMGFQITNLVDTYGIPANFIALRLLGSDDKTATNTIAGVIRNIRQCDPAWEAPLKRLLQAADIGLKLGVLPTTNYKSFEGLMKLCYIASKLS